MVTLARPLTRVLALAATAMIVASGAARAAAPPAYRVPVPVERTLPNGLRVVVFPDHHLPIVQMELLIPAGSAGEAAGAPGAASATAQLLRAGTSSRTANVLASDLERRGGSLSAAATRDLSTLSGTFLAADLDAGLELLADVAVNPIFPPEALDGLRTQYAARLRQAGQIPAALAEGRLWELAFGAHPYARNPLGSLATIERLDWDALRAFHRDFYRPDRSVLIIAGDADPERAFAAAADRFANWAGHAATVPVPSVPAPPASPRIWVVDRPELAQSEVRIGFLAPPRGDPDALPLQVASYLLGGSRAASRLPRALRAGGGPAVDIRSTYAVLRDAGLVSVAAVAPHDSVVALVTRVRDELSRLTRQPPDEAELVAARRYFVDGFPLQFQTPTALMTQWAGADFSGLGLAWLQRYPESVAAVTAAGVAQAASRWLDPSHMLLVVVGPAATLEPALRPFGPVEIVGAAEAPSAPAPAMAPPDSAQLRRGRQLLDRALVAHGGATRLRRVKDSTVDGDQFLSLGGNETEIPVKTMRKEPDRMRFSTRISSFENGQILNGRQGWAYASHNDTLTVADVDSIGVAAMRVAFRSDVVHTLLAAAQPSVQLIARGPGKVDGQDVEVVEVVRPAAPGGARPERSLLHLDAATHRLVAEDLGEDPARPETYQVRRVYRDFRTVDGVLWPFYEERRLGGTKTMYVLVRTVTLNSGLVDAWFERPRETQPAKPIR